MKIEGFVKSLQSLVSVIPAKAGIQLFRLVLTPAAVLRN
jgi:hypothetical protein